MPPWWYILPWYASLVVYPTLVCLPVYPVGREPTRVHARVQPVCTSMSTRYIRPSDTFSSVVGGERPLRKEGGTSSQPE